MDTHESGGGRVGRSCNEGAPPKWWGIAAAAIVVCVALLGCGKKGPPLAPLNLVPDRPAAVTARVIDNTVYLHTTIPAKNANGPGPAMVDRLELYAVTVAAGAAPPPNRDLLQRSRVVGTVAVRPPSDPDAPVDEEAPKDTRPAPGDPAEFAETLTAAQLAPQITASAAASKSGGAPSPIGLETPAAAPTTSPESVPAGGAAGGSSGTAGLPGGSAAGISAAFLAQLPDAGPLTGPGSNTPLGDAAVTPAVLKIPARIYIIRGVTKKGRGGAPSARLLVQLQPPPPPPPTAVAATFTESAVAVTWQAPSDAIPLKYNVYDADGAKARPGAPAPLNPQPLEAPSFQRAGAQSGVEHCFVVRSVELRQDVAFESEASAPACVTPRDIFPPAAPKALAAVAGAGAINLIWDPNGEPDVAGYVVLRGEAPDGTLQPLTPQPIKETRYVDASAKAGVQYVYVVLAVDKAGNRSPNSNRVVETAR